MLVRSTFFRFSYSCPFIDVSLVGDNNLELVICILRGADEPRLSPDDLERVVNAGKSHRRFMKKYPSQLAKAQTDDSGVRLVLDLQVRPFSPPPVEREHVELTLFAKSDVPTSPFSRSRCDQNPGDVGGRDDC